MFVYLFLYVAWQLWGEVRCYRDEWKGYDRIIRMGSVVAVILSVIALAIVTALYKRALDAP